MTLTLPPRPSSGQESSDQDRAGADALIREAKRLHRRRRRQRAALVTAAFLLAAGLITAARGGGPPPPTKRPAPSARHPGRPLQRRVQGPSLGPATSYQLTGPIGVAVNREG